MHIVTGFPDGIFAWAELQTPDRDAAHAFYSGLFGWEIVDRSPGGGVVYDMATLDGRSVAGIFPHVSEMAILPAFWLTYVKYDDIDAVIACVRAEGGTIIAPAHALGEAARTALIMDLSGAIVGLWEPGSHIGAELVNSPNSLAWTELQTTDIEAVRPFYKSAFNWTDHEADDGYVTFMTDGRAQASCVAIKAHWRDVPSNWLPYFLVEDVGRKVDRVVELGGRVVHGPFAPSDYVRAAVLQDPQGAPFAVMQYHVSADVPVNS